MFKKPFLPRILLGTFGLLFASPGTLLHAGSAVAVDGHGGYGYSYGPRRMDRLQHEAVERCMRQSSYPDDVHVVASTNGKGAGVIVRYYLADRQHVYAYVGASCDREAFRGAAGYAKEHGGRRIEVAERWSDD